MNDMTDDSTCTSSLGDINAAEACVFLRRVTVIKNCA